MNNYVSFGCDAEVCSHFHALRESLPSICSSRLGNKIFYTLGGTGAFFAEHVPLERVVRLVVDGRPVSLPSDVYGLMILNICSYAGGADLWGPSSSCTMDDVEMRAAQRVDDQMLEVVGVSGTFHLGAGAVGLASGHRIARGSLLTLEFQGDSRVYYQLDGEPAQEPLQAPAVVRIRYLGQARLQFPQGK